MVDLHFDGDAMRIDLSQVPNSPATSYDVAALINALAELQLSTSDKYPWYYPEGAKGRMIDPFVYVTEFLPLASLASQQNQLQIGGDAAFLLVTTKLVATDADDESTFLAEHPFLMSIVDSGSGRSLSNALVHADNWFGNAQRPDIWEMVKVFAPNSTITVTAQNLVASAFNVRLAFCGYKIFQYTPE